MREARKRREAFPKEIETLLRSMIEKNPAVMLLLDPATGKIFDANAAAVAYYGYSRDVLRSLHIGQINMLPPDELSLRFREERDSKQNYFIFSHKLANGEERTVEVHSTPIDFQGKTLLFSIIHDVTERQRAEKILEARLRLMQFSATHSLEELLIATIDEAEILTGSQVGLYHFLNPDQKTLLLQAWSTRTTREMCRAEGKGLHYDISKAGVWVDCIHQRRAVIHNDYEALSHRKGMPPGHAPIVRELVVPVFRQDKIVAILGVGNKPTDYDSADIDTITLLADMAWDIAERKLAEAALRESEQRFRAIFDCSPLGIAVIDSLTGRFLQANASYAAILGRTVEDMLTRDFMDVTHPDDLQEDLDNMAALREGRIRSFTMEKRYLRPDGGSVWVKLSIVPLWAKGEPPRLHLAMVENITERKRDEQFREDVQRIIRHDIKTPLLGVFSMAQLAMRGKLDAGLMELFPQIARGIRQVVHLLDAAEPLRLMERGEYIPRKDSISLLQLLSSVKESLEELARQGKVGIVVPPAAAADSLGEPLLCGEAFLIEDMLMNLVKNAVEASPPGGTVTVTWHTALAEQCIDIHNDGIIPENVRERFFDKYSSSGKAHGTGLGTYSAQLIAKAHKGRIAFRTAEAEGTTVTVFLPSCPTW